MGAAMPTVIEALLISEGVDTSTEEGAALCVLAEEVRRVHAEENSGMSEVATFLLREAELEIKNLRALLVDAGIQIDQLAMRVRRGCQ